MLSILIPVYNFNVDELVRHLHAQGLEQDVPFEVIMFNDGSDASWKDSMDSLAELEDVRVFHSPN